MLHHILGFAVDGFELEVVPRPPYLPSYHLQRLASVSKASLPIMKHFAAQFNAASLTLGSDESMTPEYIPPMYPLVESKGAAVRCLSVNLGMKQLRSVELAPARLTGEGIFEYLRCVSKESETVGEERSIEIRLGGHQRTPLAPPRFYAEIVTFLRLLSEISEEELGAATCRQKPEIYIKNPYESKVDRIWCEPFMRDSLMPALEAVQAKHPSLGLGVWLFGRKGNVFSRIDFICLKWCPKSEFDRQLFHEWAEEDAERDTYRDARMYEAISDDDGHYEENDGDDDDGDDNEISVQDLLLWRAIMARFTNEDER
ncbi:uncharacterized protein IUM83_19286 [Phytophthora cinnamomi]|uniref:uncharacterized protein n=1 Tax=Phytophthora cinnamomi TaxID=4785 RepID=UPI00355A4D93|nr:hypothetical protein IUM83_19286 [Phytophthora cinnamomi]